MDNRELRRRLKLANTQIINELGKLREVVDRAIEEIFLEVRKKVEEYTKKLYDEVSGVSEESEPRRIVRVEEKSKKFGRASLLLILGHEENSDLRVYIPEKSESLALLLISSRDKGKADTLIRLIKTDPELERAKDVLSKISFDDREGILILQGRDEKEDEEDYILEVFGAGAIILHHFEGRMTRGVPYIMPPQRAPIYMRIRNPFDTGGLFLFGIGKALSNKEIKKHTIELMKNIAKGEMEAASKNFTSIRKLLEINPIGNTVIGVIRIKPKKPKPEALPKREKQSVGTIQRQVQPPKMEIAEPPQKLEATSISHGKTEKVTGSQLTESVGSSKEYGKEYLSRSVYKPQPASFQRDPEHSGIKLGPKQKIGKARKDIIGSVVYIFYLVDSNIIDSELPIDSGIRGHLEGRFGLVIEHDKRLWVEPQIVNIAIDEAIEKSRSNNKKIAIFILRMNTLREYAPAVESHINRLISNAFYVILLIEDPTESIPVHPTTIDTLRRKINNKMFRVHDARRFYVVLYNNRASHTQKELENLVAKYIRGNVLGVSHG